MLLLYKILMGIAAIFGVVSLTKIKNKFLSTSVFVFVLGIIWATVKNPYLSNSFAFYYTGMVLFMVYVAFLSSDFSTQKRTILLLITALVFTHGLFVISGWPYVYILKSLQVIPLLLFLLKVLPNRKEYKAEMGALIIITTDALIQVISFALHTVDS